MTLPTGVRKTDPCAGLTLIELSVVIFILSIVVVAAVPRFRNTYENIKFRNTVYNIVKLMYYARDRAIIERTPFRIRFFEDGPAFCLESQATEQDEESDKKKRGRRRRKKEAEFEEVSGSIGRKIFFPKDVTFDIEEPDRVDYVTFYPDGQSDECVIYIIGGDDMTYTITTKEAIGIVKLYKERKRL